MPRQTWQTNLPFGATAIILLTVFLHGCANEKTAPVAAPPLVSVMEVQPRDVPIFSDFAAQTYARNMVDVRGRVAGYVDRWLFQPGAEVAAGQVLYVLDLRPFEASVQQARGNLNARARPTSILRESRFRFYRRRRTWLPPRRTW